MPLPKIKHPTFEVTIPSTGERTKMRPMLVRDEKILLMAKESDDKSDIFDALKQVVNNCLVGYSGSLDNLALFDLEYMFVRLRAQSVSNVTKVSYRDDGDQKVYDFEVDLNEVIVKGVDKIQPIPASRDVSIQLRYPPAALYSDKDFLNTTSGVAVYDKLIRASILHVKNGTDILKFNMFPVSEQEEFINDLGVDTRRQIVEFLDNVPTLEYVINYTNSEGKEKKIVLSTLTDFFMLA
jgi:hypothetical protein